MLSEFCLIWWRKELFCIVGTSWMGWGRVEWDWHMGMSNLTSLNPQLFKNIAYVGPFKHFSVHLFLSVFRNPTESIANCCEEQPWIWKSVFVFVFVLSNAILSLDQCIWQCVVGNKADSQGRRLQAFCPNNFLTVFVLIFVFSFVFVAFKDRSCCCYHWFVLNIKFSFKNTLMIYKYKN